MIRLHVTSAAQRELRRGHPWLFSDSIREQSMPGKAGDLAAIYDSSNKFMAVGLYDPNSPLRVRILHRGKPAVIDAAWFVRALESAMGKRQGLFTADTNAWRWINGESDGWPGLVLDRYGDALVLKLYTSAWFSRLDELRQLFVRVLQPASIILRLSRNIQSLGLTEGCIHGEPVETIIFQENGIAFEADLLRGQKTGFFLDQRENRKHVREISAGCDVLNAFSFSGGFSLYAAQGGAKSTTDLDISAHALKGVARNFALNPSIQIKPQVIQADAFAWFENEDRRRFDLIILDPPSLAKKESDRAAAIAAYENLARAAAGRLRPGGVLVAASCSAHVSAAEFFSAVLRATGPRTKQELWRSGHAADHPATFAEANYLKCVALELS